LARWMSSKTAAVRTLPSARSVSGQSSMTSRLKGPAPMRCLGAVNPVGNIGKRRAGSGRGRGGGEQVFDGGGVHRFDEVVVEAGRAGAGAVLVLAVAGQGDEQRLGPGPRAAQAAGDFVAVHAGQADVQEDDLRTGGGEGVQR